MKASKAVQNRDPQTLGSMRVTDTRSLVTVEYEDWAEAFSIAEARMLLDAIEIAWERGGECEMKSARRRLMVERDFFGVAIQIHVERGWPACLVKKESDALCDMLREVFERRSCVVPLGCERVEMRCDECSLCPWGNRRPDHEASRRSHHDAGRACRQREQADMAVCRWVLSGVQHEDSVHLEG